jgi:hypothetical protein
MNRLGALQLRAEPEAAAPELDPVRAPHVAEVKRIREVAERHSRAHRALLAMMLRLTDPKGETKRVAIEPQLPVASIAQHPKRREPRDTDPWWPAVPIRPARPLTAHTGDDSLSRAEAMTETVGISVMGLRGSDLDNVVEGIASEQLKDGSFRPLFLTDSPDFQAFASRGYSFEYLSTFRDYVSPKGPELRDARREELVAKWGLSRIINRDDARAIRRNHAPVAALLKHNSDMSRACHHDRLKWVTETLRMAIAMERFDIIEGLADYLLAFFNTLDKPAVIPAARALGRKFIAFGELEQLRMFLFKNIASVKKDDNLFTWFSAYCTSGTEFLREFTVLPSGKINAYYISKRMAAAGEQVVHSLLTAGEAATPNENLILANYFATRGDAALYKMFVNRVLGKHAATTISRIALGKGNILSQIQFDKPPVAPDQHERVTVIMSAFNSAATIGYAVRSILNQSYANLELLVCDDGSADGTLAELERFRSDPRLRIFKSATQQGTYGIRNALIAEAKGAYITFQDSDDFAFPDRLTKQVAFLKSSGAAAVVGQWFRVTPDGEFIFSSDHAVARLAVVSLLAPKPVFERFGPYRNARIGADTEFYERLRLALGTDAVKLMPVPLLFGLAAANSLTRSAGLEATEDGYRAPARRAYAAASSRHRYTRGALFEAADIDDILAEQGILMRQATVESVGAP